jgi:hypothetical protein
MGTDTRAWEGKLGQIEHSDARPNGEPCEDRYHPFLGSIA